MKNNACEIRFYCNNKINECIYFKKKIDGSCLFLNLGCECVSSVANVNRMVLELKEQGIDIVDGIE